jgi:ribokinase
MTQVLVVGSVNMDIVARVPRFPDPGETVRGSRLDLIPGGKGANQAVAASRLAVDTAMIGRVGSDAFGAALANGLASEGVLPLVEVSQGSSGIALITVDRDGENSIIIIPGANGLVSPSDVGMYDEHFENADVLLVQFELPMETVAAAVAMGRSHGILTVVDPAPAPASDVEIPQEIWDADVFSPNQTEAEALTGISVTSVETAVSAAQLLLERGPRAIVIKMGALGAIYVDRDSAPLYQSAKTVIAMDSTAAGDAFMAAFAVRFAETKQAESALAWGCAAGAIAVQHYGAQTAMPKRGEVSELAHQLRPSKRL